MGLEAGKSEADSEGVRMQESGPGTWPWGSDPQASATKDAMKSVVRAALKASRDLERVATALEKIERSLRERKGA